MLPKSPATVSPVPLHEDKLRHLPAVAQAAFRRYSSGGDPKDLDIVIFAIVQDFAPKRGGAPVGERDGATRLMEDLGLDSLAITEIAFFTEDLFRFSISNEEIQPVRTLDDLRAFVRHKAAGADSPTA